MKHKRLLLVLALIGITLVGCTQIGVYINGCFQVYGGSYHGLYCVPMDVLDLIIRIAEMLGIPVFSLR